MFPRLEVIDLPSRQINEFSQKGNRKKIELVARTDSDQPENARILVPSPAMVGLDAFESVYIKSKDRTRIHMFFIKPRSNLPEQQVIMSSKLTGIPRHHSAINRF